MTAGIDILLIVAMITWWSLRLPKNQPAPPRSGMPEAAFEETQNTDVPTKERMHSMAVDRIGFMTILGLWVWARKTGQTI